MRYLPKPLDLQEVLKRLLDVFGGNRVLFGTDSRHASEGYRHWLLQSQREALEALDASDEVRRAVLGGNMARLLRISW
jgi:predicted TIM-barrel fold metal-dependent hydrolase